MIEVYEEIGSIPRDTIGTPDMHFFIYESLCDFDHKKEKVYVVEDNIYSGRSNDAVRQSLGQSGDRSTNPSTQRVHPSGLAGPHFTNHIEKKVFMEMVEKAKKLIREGDMFQCPQSTLFSRL